MASMQCMKLCFTRVSRPSQLLALALGSLAALMFTISSVAKAAAPCSYSFVYGGAETDKKRNTRYSLPYTCIYKADKAYAELRINNWDNMQRSAETLTAGFFSPTAKGMQTKPKRCTSLVPCLHAAAGFSYSAFMHLT